MDNIFGFKYEYYYSNPYENNKYFYYGTNNSEDLIDIKGYDYYLNINSWNEKSRNVGDLVLKYNNSNNVLIISKNGIALLEQDITKLVKDIHEKQELKGINTGKDMVEYTDMTYEVEINQELEKIRLKFIFTDISGRFDNDNKLIVESVGFILLVSNK